MRVRRCLTVGVARGGRAGYAPGAAPSLSWRVLPPGGRWGWPGSLNPVPLLEIVTRVQELDVLSHNRRSSKGIRNHVVEVQLVASAADHTSTLIPFPDCELHTRWNDPTPLYDFGRWTAEIILARDGEEPELEDLAATIRFAPGVDKMEDPVVRPNTCVDLLVHADAFGRAFSPLEVLCGLVKQAVLSEPAAWRAFGLVMFLRIQCPGGTGEIVSLVDQNGTALLEAIRVGRIPTERHENHRVVATQPEVHPALEAGALAVAHLQIGDDLIGHSPRTSRPGQRIARNLQRPCARFLHEDTSRGALSG